MTRRTLLKWLAYHSVALPLSPLLAAGKLREKNPRHLILIELAGGNDGLNTVIPYQNPLYYRYRPHIAIPRKSVIPLEGSLGLHPSLVEMASIYQEGEMAIVQGLGYPDPNRSHFRSIEIWETASGAHRYLDRGWIETLRPPLSHQKMQAVVLKGAYGPLSGAEKGVIKIQNLRGFLNRTRRMHAEIYMTAGNESLKYILETEAEIRESAKILGKYFKTETPLPYPFPKTDFGRQMKVTANLIRHKAPIPIFKLQLSSFDTHINQLPKQAHLLHELSQGIELLQKNLIESGDWERTLLMTYSEFGRRVVENASRGTDHGTAAPHFVIGGKVKGGLYGKTPSLEQLDKNGDLIFTTDYRSYYHTIARHWLGNSSPLIDSFPMPDFL